MTVFFFFPPGLGEEGEEKACCSGQKELEKDGQ